MLTLAWSGFERADLHTLECGVWVHFGLFLAVAFHCLRRPRDPRSTLAWLFAVWVVPVLGALLYILFGINRVKEKGWQKHESDQAFHSNRDRREQEASPLAYWRGLRQGLLARPADAGAQELNDFLNRLAPNHPLLGGNAVRILVDAHEAYPEMFTAIRNARHHIHLQSYIIGADETGRELMEALSERAASSRSWWRSPAQRWGAWTTSSPSSCARCVRPSRSLRWRNRPRSCRRACA